MQPTKEQFEAYETQVRPHLHDGKVQGLARAMSESMMHMIEAEKFDPIALALATGIAVKAMVKMSMPNLAEGQEADYMNLIKSAAAIGMAQNVMTMKITPEMLLAAGGDLKKAMLQDVLGQLPESVRAKVAEQAEKQFGQAVAKAAEGATVH